MKRLLFALLLMSGFADAQWSTANTFKVIEFDGTTVADKVTNAQAACNADTAINCIIIFDPLLSKFSPGTLPAKCTQCTWVDARTPASLFGNATGNQFLIPDGTAALPGLGFVASPTYGIYRTGGVIAFSQAGNPYAVLGPNFNGQLNVVSGGALSFSSSATSAITGADTLLRRDAANTLALRNGTAAQSFRAYQCFNTTADSSYLEFVNSGSASVIKLTNGGGLSTCSDSATLQIQSTGVISLRSGASERFGITTTGVQIGEGATITQHLTGTATLDFASMAANTCLNLTITVTGAAVGDTVVVGLPTGIPVTNTFVTGYVSATNTVTVRSCNVAVSASADPASGVYRADVWKH